MIHVTCPSCRATHEASPAAKGPRVRCGHCGATFRVEDERPARRPPPLPRAAQPPKRPLLLGLLLGGGAVLLVGLVVGTVVLVWVMRGGGGGRGTPVTAADLDRIDIYMTKAEVEGIVGKGAEAGSGDIEANWYAAGQQCGATVWYKWPNGDDALFVGFGESKRSGTRRAVIAFYKEEIRTPTATGQEYKKGFLHLAAFGGDLDDLATEKQRERDLLASPRWKKGPAKRQALVGEWVAVFIGMYQFNADGTCRAESPGEKAAGTYKFLGDDKVELALTIAPFMAGQKPRGVTRRYRVLVDEAELILIDERFPRARPTVYKRQR